MTHAPSGLSVAQLMLGTMTFGKAGGSDAAMIGATGQDLATRMVGLSNVAASQIAEADGLARQLGTEYPAYLPAWTRGDAVFGQSSTT